MVNMEKWLMITDRRQSPRPLEETVKRALERGLRKILLREKDLDSRALYDLALPLRTLTKNFQAQLFIHDRVDVAQAVGADGVHLGWRSLPPEKVRALWPAPGLLGVSCHNGNEAERAWAVGADYITFGPIFSTPSKEGLLVPTGLEALKAIKEQAGGAVFALGGISEERAQAVLEAGADGLAAIRAFL